MEDQQIETSLIGKLKHLLTQRNIFIVFGVAVALEIIWASWTFLKPAAVSNIGEQQNTPVSQPTVVTLSAAKTSLTAGEKVTVEINVSSNKKTDGTDLIITYDPQLLSVETVGTGKNPITAGTIYPDYPLNSLDSALGRITISGITGSPGGVLADGLFGVIVFQAQSAGLANINLDFSPGATVDSNVIESGTGKDLLDQVNNLQINILP